MSKARRSADHGAMSNTEVHPSALTTHSILVAVDGGNESIDAIAAGHLLAQARGARLRLIHVRRSSARTAPSPSPALVDRARGLTGDTSLGVETYAGASTAAVLADLASSDDVVAVVLGSRPHQRWRPPFRRGRLARRLMRTLSCAVVVVPAGYAQASPARLRVIGSGYDRSPAARSAWDVACRIARSTGATVRAIAAYRGASSAVLASGWAVPGDDLLRDTGRDLEELVSHAPAGVATERHLAEGDPVHVLADASAGLDLLVVGHGAYGIADARWHRSVARRLIARSACPTVVAPRRRSAQIVEPEDRAVTEPAERLLAGSAGDRH